MWAVELVMVSLRLAESMCVDDLYLEDGVVQSGLNKVLLNAEDYLWIKKHATRHLHMTVAYASFTL